jgi:hypothetical protein
MMPIPPVAREARCLDTVDRADIAGAHHRDKPLKGMIIGKYLPKCPGFQ